MSVEIPNDLIEIRDPEIDPGAIMEQIRQRVRRRRDELGYEKRTFPTFGLTACPVEPDDVPFDPNLYHHLRLANTTYDQVEVAPILVPSPATRTPVVGRFWALVRWHFHTLILFYVNRAVRHQTGVNRHLISVLNQLTALTQDQQRTIAALQAEIETLRQQIAK